MISFIIVSYNSSKTIFSTINSILDSVLEPCEIIVIDNNSPDKCYLNKLDGLNSIVLIKSDKNLGFAKANNIGILKSSGDVICCINPDVYINKLALQNLIDNVDSGVVVSSRLYGEDGQINKSVSLIPFLSNYLSKIVMRQGKYWVHGALLIFSRNDIFKIGLWSEEYFMYSEDVDICYKIHLNKMKLKVIDEQVIHIGGTSTSTVWSDLERSIIVERSSYQFYKKYGKLVDYYLINLFVIAKMLLIRHSSVKNKIKSVFKVVTNG